MSQKTEHTEEKDITIIKSWKKNSNLIRGLYLIRCQTIKTQGNNSFRKKKKKAKNQKPHKNPKQLQTEESKKFVSRCSQKEYFQALFSEDLVNFSHSLESYPAHFHWCLLQAELRASSDNFYFIDQRIIGCNSNGLPWHQTNIFRQQK